MFDKNSSSIGLQEAGLGGLVLDADGVTEANRRAEIAAWLCRQPTVLDFLKDSVRVVLKRALYPRPGLFWPVCCMLHRRWFFNNDYDLLVDGFPRSANTFVVSAFRASSRGIKLLCHRHIPTYVIHACRIGKPVCLLIREPEAAIASWAIYSRVSLDFAINMYINYYESLVLYRDDALVVSFEQAVHRFPNVVRALNQKFGSDFSIPVYDETFERKVLERVRTFPWAADPLTVSLPTRERSRLLAVVHERLQAPRYRDRLERAAELYRHFLLATHAVEFADAKTAIISPRPAGH